MAAKKQAKNTRRSSAKSTNSSRSSRPSSSRKPSPRKSARKEPPMGDRTIRPGFISHTELASSDPAATKEWAVKSFGWKFGDAMPLSDGSTYHLWSFPDGNGGGIRSNNPPEAPGSIPYVEVKDIKAAYNKALQNGATEMMPPMQIPGSGGWTAIVQAPGGPAIGLWGMK